jgi:hypothetical protein
MREKDGFKRKKHGLSAIDPKLVDTKIIDMNEVGNFRLPQINICNT